MNTNYLLSAEVASKVASEGLQCQQLLLPGAPPIEVYDVATKRNLAFGATVKSQDGGKTWKSLALIREQAGVYLDAETGCR